MEDLGATVVILLIVVAAWYVIRDELKKTRNLDIVKLENDRGLAVRYQPMLVQLGIIANDVKVLRSSLTSVELTATLLSHKTYLILNHHSFPHARVNVEIAVVTKTGTRKKQVDYLEPSTPLAVLRDILVELEKLIDNV